VTARHAWCLFVVLAGCNGTIMGGLGEVPVGGGGGPGGGGTGAGGGPTEPPFAVPRFTCDETRLPTELPLRRLSRAQVENALRDLLGTTGLTAAERSAALAAVEPALSAWPEDRLVGVPGERHGGFRQLDQAIQQGHIDVSYAVATELGRELTSSSAKLGRLLGGCATDASTANDAQCLTDFVRAFGLRVHRRPLEADDVAFYTAVAGATPVSPAAVADVVALLLTSPRFLYHVEEGDPSGSGPTPLDAYALASRLSFHFWQTMPDEALFAAAASGELLTDDGYRAQVQRLFDDPRTDVALDDFFGHWFRLDELPPLNTRLGTPVFDAFAAGFAPSATLHREMMGEVLAASRDVVRREEPVGALLTSRRFVARDGQLASLYGQPAWDGSSAPEDFTHPARVGLLTRAAFLATGSANTRPVMKGFRIRNGLLCQSIPPPPDNAMATPIELAADLTTRETVEAITEAPGSGCAGCHSILLNPLGFATEDFDALGRHRTAQQLFDAAGQPTVSKPVSTRVVPWVSGVAEPIEGAAELTQLLASGGEFQTCFVRQYFRFTFQRMEDEARDGCLLASLQAQALAGRPLRELLMAAALAPEFRRRDVR
jgi:hypothetical protein